MTIGPTFNRVAGKSGSSKPQSFSIRKRRRGDRQCRGGCERDQPLPPEIIQYLDRLVRLECFPSVTRQDHHRPCDVLRVEGLGRVRISIDQRKQKPYGIGIAAHGDVSEPTEHHFKRGDPARLAVFGYDDLLLKDVVEDCSYRPAAFWASLRIAAFASRKLGRLWRSPVADDVIRRS